MIEVVRTSQIAPLLELLREGNETAARRLIDYAAERMRALAHAMLQGNPVHRWEGTDDLLQQSLLRLHRSLERARPTTVDVFLGLAALEMRHALVDYARHYFGPLGIGANHESQCGEPSRASRPLAILASSVPAPGDQLAQIEQWEQLYAAIGDLPDEEREVVDLLWIHNLSQSETATVLGVALKTVGRPWRRARLRLYDALDDSAEESR